MNSPCFSTCGDSIVASNEVCDNNPANGDGCSSLCALEYGFSCSGSPSVCFSTCGDGQMASNEICDDGNLDPSDGCSPLCSIEPNGHCTHIAN